MPDNALTVTDLKQWIYCPRVAYYLRCLPKVRPITYRMVAAKDAHDDEAEREHRRSLRTYGLADGERSYAVDLTSNRLGIRGKVDLVVQRADEVIPIEYKDSDGPGGQHFLVQLAAYGLLLEEATGLPARRGFIYFIPTRRRRRVDLTDALKQKAAEAIMALQQMIQTESMPKPTPQRERCTNCEFRRFCNDVI